MTLPRAADVLPVPSEEQEQRWLFEWADTQRVRWPELAELYAVPNGGKRSRAVAGKLKAQGVKRGVPDVQLDVPRGPYHGLRIELKKRRGGRLEEDQRSWGERLQRRGYCWNVAYGWEQARDVILAYLALAG